MAVTEDRRTRIADAVIATLAERGSRGLTHRAVDEAAGLPTGSTSYYYRSRAALLRCAVPRLAELDSQAVDWQGGHLQRTVAHVLQASLRDDGYVRTLARYELVLEASRRPDLRQELASGTERLLVLLAERFEELRSRDGKMLARDLLAFIDGLLLAEVTSPAESRRTPAQLRAAVKRYVDGVIPGRGR